MSKTFRAYDMNQQLLLPPDLRQWLHDDHLALYVSDVVETLDLSAFINSYEEGDSRGRPPYHPALMVKLLVYGYCTGRMSSRKLEQATYDDVAFRVLCCDQHPDHDSIAEFRKRHLAALGQLFVQVLQLCQRAGLVKLGQVAVDSTKIKANAAKTESLKYSSLERTARALEEEVVRLLSEAQRLDAAEDSLYGAGRRGHELPAELRRRETRLAKIRELKEEMEREAQQAAAQEQKQKASGEPKHYRRRRWTRNESGAVVPKDKTRRNLTDLESRLMMDTATNSYQQAYSTQIAVDGEAQIIVATRVTPAPNDQEQLVPTVLAIKKNLGQLPATVSADAGYFSSAVITAEVLRDIDLYVPPNEPEPSALPPDTGVRAQMWQKLLSSPGRELYKRRATIVEPVFAYIKHVRGFRQFRLRGLAGVEGEWLLICLTHNLMKLFRALRPLRMTATTEL
ncbi:MAG: IS1182 family transposase [Candidatus Udaeobacter sp.]